MAARAAARRRGGGGLRRPPPGTGLPRRGLSGRRAHPRTQPQPSRSEPSLTRGTECRPPPRCRGFQEERGAPGRASQEALGRPQRANESAGAVRTAGCEACGAEAAGSGLFGAGRGGANEGALWTDWLRIPGGASEGALRAFWGGAGALLRTAPVARTVMEETGGGFRKVRAVWRPGGGEGLARQGAGGEGLAGQGAGAGGEAGGPPAGPSRVGPLPKSSLRGGGASRRSIGKRARVCREQAERGRHGRRAGCSGARPGVP